MADLTPSTILVVDDAEAERAATARMLRQAGFAVREATSGSEALRLLSEGERPDLVVLAVNPPDSNGAEVCRLIKEVPETRATPILLLTTGPPEGGGPPPAPEDAAADLYLARPPAPGPLLAGVRTLLRARQGEETLQSLSLLWQTMFDGLSEGVAVVNADGTVLHYNRALPGLLGKSAQDFLDKPCHVLFEAATGQSSAELFRQLREADQRITFGFYRGGRRFHVTADPVRDRQGNLTHAVYLVDDVTERQRLEDELRRRADELAERDRYKDEFLAMLAHELRNPLAPIRNAMQALRLAGHRREVADQAQRIIERQLANMTRLVDDLLDVSRVSHGKIHLRKEPVELTAVVARALETTRPLLDARRHRLTLRLPARPVWLEGDVTRLEQILANLLNNAAKYTDLGGQIWLTAERQGGEAVLRVRDTGVGIAPEMLPRVFDLFTQVDRTLDRSEGGLGIGLTLVRNLVEMSGGSVAATSEGPGKGSEFSVRLPALPESGDDDHARRGPARQPAATRHRVLVVDDNVDSAASLALLLELDKHEVRVANDSTEALRLAESFRPDVVLLDIGLPGLDGYEVARRLRQHEGLRHAFLVAVTGYGQDEDRRRSRQAGFDEHLTKPVDPDALLTLLARPARTASPLR